MKYFEWLTRMLFKLVEILSRIFGETPHIAGESMVGMVGEAGNWIDIGFTSTHPVQLTKATWNWSGRPVILDPEGSPMGNPENRGVESYEFFVGEPTPDVGIQQFGFTATGFDSGDYFKFTMDLDRWPAAGGAPYGDDYLGGNLELEFSDGIVRSVTFDTKVSEWGAKAAFWFPQSAPPSAGKTD